MNISRFANVDGRRVAFFNAVSHDIYTQITQEGFQNLALSYDIPL